MNFSEFPHSDKLAEAFDREVILPFWERSEQLVYVVGSNGHIYYANAAARIASGINIGAEKPISVEAVFRGNGWLRESSVAYPAKLKLSVSANGEGWRVHEFDIHRVQKGQDGLFVLHEVSDVLATSDDSNALSYFVSTFCHRMNNFLGVIRLQGELLTQVATDGYTSKMAQNLLKSSREAEYYISRFAKVADAAHLFFENVDVRELCEEFVAGFDTPGGCELLLFNEAPNQLKRVRGSRDGLKSMLEHLCRNAFQALDKAGSVTIRIQTEGPHHLVIEVNDNGPGIPEEIVGKVYDPFVTTKGYPQSLGLGLTVCRIIINLHNGLLTHNRGKDGKGTSVRIVLPVAEGE